MSDGQPLQRTEANALTRRDLSPDTFASAQKMSRSIRAEAEIPIDVFADAATVFCLFPESDRRVHFAFRGDARDAASKPPFGSECNRQSRRSMISQADPDARKCLYRYVAVTAKPWLREFFRLAKVVTD
jgi:hypothetical protein